MWVEIKGLKEQLKPKKVDFFEYQEEASNMWIGAISKYNPAIEDLINSRMGIWTYRNKVKELSNKILLWKDIKKL